MKAGDGVFRSTLDKPLEELTEEDISQLTREDCRRYLKEKGMRRPSWNKSQAIQQVLSLKTLFESKPVSGDGGPKPANPSQIDSLKEPSTVEWEQKQPDPPDLEIPIPANELIFPQKKHSVTGDHLNFPANVEFRPPATGKKQLFRDYRSFSPSKGARNEPVSQLTIFYSGIVNVYDDVPADKARAIMLLAGSPNYLSHIPADGAPSNRQLPASFPIGWVKSGSVSPPATVVPSSLQNDVPKTRKESVQRFLEKRKDRLKGMHGQKRGSTSCLDVHLNQQIRGSRSDHSLNPQSSASGTCSPNGPRPPHTPARCSSIDSHAIFSLSNNLNDYDLQIPQGKFATKRAPKKVTIISLNKDRKSFRASSNISYFTSTPFEHIRNKTSHISPRCLTCPSVLEQGRQMFARATSESHVFAFEIPSTCEAEESEFRHALIRNAYKAPPL